MANNLYFVTHITVWLKKIYLSYSEYANGKSFYPRYAVTDDNLLEW